MDINKKYFCSAEQRPKNCFICVNLCCCFCEFIESCEKLNNKTKPCSEGDNEECPFLI